MQNGDRHDARDIALQLRRGGDLFADFKRQLATSERREIRAQLGGMVALPGADGEDRTGIGTSTVGANDSTLFDPGAKGPEDEFVPSGNLAVQVGPAHFRLWGFDVNSTVVRAEYADCLRRVAKLVKGDEKAKVAIEGHTSGSGQEANNMSLGDSRAVSVAASLVARGVARPRITAEGKGSSVALARAGKNPAAMARNRRVEIRLQLSKARPKPPPKSQPPPATKGFPRIKRVLAAQPKAFWQESAMCMLDKYETLGSAVDDSYIGRKKISGYEGMITGDFPKTVAEVEPLLVQHMHASLVRMEDMRDAAILAGMKPLITDARRGISFVDRHQASDGIGMNRGYLRIATWLNQKLTDPNTVLSCFR